MRQHFTSGLLRQIEVDDSEMRARRRLVLYRLDKFDRFLAIRDHSELAFNAMLFECPANQADIRRVVLHEKNENRPPAILGPAGHRHAGL